MDDIILQLGMGGALAWLLVVEIRKIISELSRKKNPELSTSKADLDRIEGAIAGLFEIAKSVKSMTKDLHEWHDHDDPMNPGSKVWYGTASMEKLKDVERRVNQIARSCGLSGRGDDD